MTEDFRERLNIKLRYLNRSDCECVSDLMEFHFFQSVSFQKTGEELPISTRLCRLCFAGQEVVVRVIRVELLYNVHQKRRNRDRPCRGFRFGRSDVKIGLALLFVIDALDSLIDADCLIRQRDVLHLQSAEFSNAYSGKECNENASSLPV